jgi:hypothetical protein
MMFVLFPAQLKSITDDLELLTIETKSHVHLEPKNASPRATT